MWREESDAQVIEAGAELAFEAGNLSVELASDTCKLKALGMRDGRGRSEANCALRLVAAQQPEREGTHKAESR